MRIEYAAAMGQRRRYMLAVALMGWLATGFVGAAGPAEIPSNAAAADLGIPPLAETIEVRVVNVDVVVLDSNGEPVNDLVRDDFTLRVDGKPVEIEYFSAVAGGHATEREGTELALAGAEDDEGYGSSGPELRPYLVVLFDGRSIHTPRASAVLADLREQSERLVSMARGVMVVRHGHKLVLGSGFTRDPSRLQDAFDRIQAQKVRASSLDRSMLIRRLEAAESATTASPEDLAANPGLEMAAISLLSEIRGYAEMERLETESAIGDLRRFVRSLGALPGRKAVLYLGAGFDPRPGEVLYRLWWEKFRPVAFEVGVNNIESEISKHRAEGEVAELVEDSNSQQVSFFTFEPEGMQTSDVSLEFESLSATRYTTAARGWRRESMQNLASGTGGMSRMDRSGIDLLVDRMGVGFRNYYSLGFEPTREGEHSGRIEVRLRNKKLKARYIKRFVSRSAATRLEEQVLAALLGDEGENPLRVGVELEQGERQKDGTYVMPVSIRVPIAHLTLLPKAQKHVGRLALVVLAQGAEGELSDPARDEVPIEIANTDLVRAMSGSVGYRMRLRVAPGEQRLAIGVRDEITGERSMLRLSVDPR